MDQSAVIHPLQPATREAPGKAQLQLATHRCRIHRETIQLLAIGLGDRGHVGGVLQATFDLETGNPQVDQLREQRPGREVLG